MNGPGFVRLSRRYFQSDLWQERREFSRAEAWLDMIATAAFAPETRLVEGRCVSLQRGELVASLRYLAERWSWSKSKVERFLSALADAKRVKDKIETGTKIIILCNYELYNPLRDEIETDKDPPDKKAGHPRDKVKEHKEALERDGEGENHAPEELESEPPRGWPKNEKEVERQRGHVEFKIALDSWLLARRRGWRDWKDVPIRCSFQSWIAYDHSRSQERTHIQKSGRLTTEERKALQAEHDRLKDETHYAHDRTPEKMARLKELDALLKI